MTRQINDAGLNLIKSFEGLRLTAYDDSTGVWTIGYGHIKGVQQGQTITAEQADEFLREDLADAEAAVEHLPVPLNDNQFAALVSFAFNLGPGNLRSLFKYGLAAVPERMMLFSHAGGHVMMGLVRRRAAERRLFLQPV